MNVQCSLAAAVIPDIHYVAGIPLRPFSLGHWLCLTRLRLSFAVAGEHHSSPDLMLAILVCSRSFAEASRSVQSGEIVTEARRWYKMASGGVLARLRRGVGRKFGRKYSPQEIAGFDFHLSCGHFVSYLSAHSAPGYELQSHSSRPVLMSKQGGSHLVASPDIALLAAAILAEFPGVSISELMDMPLPMVRWLWAIHRERTGEASIVDPEELSADRKAADEFVKRLKEEGAI